jgi:FkbM family methyltransferase
MTLTSIFRRLKQPFQTGNGWVERTKRDHDLILAQLPTLLKPRSNCVDVGAHTGEWLDYFLRFAPEGNHCAFEALPELADQLRKKYPTVRVESCAVADTNGQAVFNRAVNQPGWSGLRKQHYGSDTLVEEFPVALKTLDTLIGEDQPIAFIKLDIEGAEYSAFVGGQQTIRKSRPAVIFEYAFVHVENYQISPEMMWDLLVKDYQMGLFGLDRTPIPSRDIWVRKCNYAAESNYGRDAETNFLALPAAS